MTLSNLSPWWRGWLRVTVALSPVTFLVAAFFFANEAGKNNWLVLSHISPDYSLAATSVDVGASYFAPYWCFRAAAPLFVSEPSDVQRQRAAAFFDSELRPILDDLYFEEEPFRSEFIRLSSDAPIKEWSTTDGPLRYRDLSSARPDKKRGVIARDGALWGLGLLALVMVPVLVVATTVRWVVRGFSGGT